MFAFITNVRAKPGKRDELIALTETMQQATATEAGVPVYVFHAAEDDPDELWFYDLYVSEEAYNAHCATPEFQNMIATIATVGEIKVMHKLLPYGQVKSAGL
jgi:quinol monooxygenase YgiN